MNHRPDSRATHERSSIRMRPLHAAPLDRCMYCLGTAGARTEEHLVPRALGGRLTLRDAVCEPCRRLTGRLEQMALDREFAVPRVLLALKRRRARGSGPNRLPAVVLEGDAGASALTPDTFPRGFWLPTFERAGLLAGAEGGAGAVPSGRVECRLNLGTPSRHAVAAAAPAADAHACAWSIAKWAYALAVAERGLACCDTQALRALMLGARHDVLQFVGTPSPRVDASGEWLHEFALRESGPWLTVTLALFSSAGMVPYEVVIGRLHAAAADD